jgi:hypothetical protein
MASGKLISFPLSSVNILSFLNIKSSGATTQASATTFAILFLASSAATTAALPDVMVPLEPTVAPLSGR